MQPCDSHRPRGGRVFQAPDHVVEVRDALRFLVDPGRWHGLHLEFDFQDVTSEAHASDRSPEEITLLIGCAIDDVPTSNAYTKRPNMITNASINMVVLAMHVGGDHT